MNQGWCVCRNWICALSAIYRSAWQDAQPNRDGVLVLLQVNSQDHLMQRKCRAGGIIHVLSRALKLVCKNCRIILQSDINTSLRERSVESSISKISVP